MRRLSVESTPIRTQVDILTRPVSAETAGSLSKVAAVKGRERFTKSPDLRVITDKTALKGAGKSLINPNLMRRSGCRCIDKNDPEPTMPPCKSRFCEKKRVKSQFGGAKQNKERSLRKGAVIRLPGASGMKKIGSPSVEQTQTPKKRAA